MRQRLAVAGVVRKAQPTPSAQHVDAVLTNISVAYIQSQADFIATQVFPVVPVDKQTDKYYTYTKADWFRDEAQKRADSAESVGSGYNLSTDSYSCDVWAFHKDVGDQARANADAPINVDADATRFVTNRLLLRQEIQWASDAFATGIWATDKVGTTDFVKWSDYAGSDPLTDIEAGKETILSSTGFMPNTLVLGYGVWRFLKNHPDIVDRIKYTSSEMVSVQLLARMLELDRVLISRAVRNTAVEGATAAMSFVFGGNALLCYVNPSPGLLVPSAGYTMGWRGVAGALGTEVAINRMRIDTKKTDRIEGEMAFDHKIVATDLGYFFSVAV